MTHTRPDLQAHYGREGLAGRLLALLETCEVAGGRSVADSVLARADEFHPGGRAVTEELAGLVELAAGARVLDLGCGIGGPARWLRRRVGSSGAVTGVDAVADYCAAARALNARDAATADIVIEQADVLSLGLGAEPFDVVWSQQAQMNVADKAGWLAAVVRHLKPGGCYAFFETFAGPAGEPVYPVPWAGSPESSWLVTSAAWRDALTAAGLVRIEWLERTEQTIRWLDDAVAGQRALTAAGDPAAALNVGVLLGPRAADMSRNLRRNLAEDRLSMSLGVWARRP